MKHARADYDERIQDSAGLIPDDEPVLLIRGQDICAVAAVDAWLKAARELGADEATIAAVQRHRLRVVEWQESNAAKLPDAPAEALGV